MKEWLFLYAMSTPPQLLPQLILYTLDNRRIPKMLIIMFKALKKLPNEYLGDLFEIRYNINNLRGVKDLP